MASGSRNKESCGIGTSAHSSAEVSIGDESIRLGQFLKLAGIIDSGAEAKEVIAAGLVRVNGEVETRRGKQLRPGDRVEFGGAEARVAGHDDSIR